MSKNWPAVKLGEVLELVTREETVEATKEYRLLGIRLDGRGPFLRELVTGTQTSAAKFSRVASGDFIYSRLFAWRGAFGVIGPELEGCYVSGEFPTFLPKNGKVDIDFLRYWFRLRSTLSRVEEDCSGSTPLTRNRFKEQFFLGLELPLPPLAEQRRIVARIEELAARVEEARGLRLRTLDQEVPLLCNQMCRHAFGFDPSTESFGVWPLVRLGDICSLITDGTHQTPHYVDEGMPFLSAQNIKPYKFMPEIHRKVSLDDYAGYTRHTKPEKGDILMTRVGAMIGEAAMIDQNFDFAFYVSLCLIKPRRDRVHTPYLVHWLNSPFGVAAAKEKTLGKGHSQGNLNLKLIREFKLPLPPMDEQLRFTTRLDDIQAQIREIRTIQLQTAKELDSLMPSILDRAFRGEL